MRMVLLLRMQLTPASSPTPGPSFEVQKEQEGGRGLQSHRKSVDLE